jgi:hypothetical protein
MPDCDHPLYGLKKHLHLDRRPLVARVRCPSCGLSSPLVAVQVDDPGTLSLTGPSTQRLTDAFHDAVQRAKDPRVDALLRRVRA